MRLYPSMMCADFAHLEREVRELEQAGVDGFHLDVMDGHFVPNYALGLGDVAAICAMTELSCDTHLMVSNPLDVAPLFVEAGASIVYVHPECDPHVCRTLARIRELGAKAGLAINPGTSFETVREALHEADMVLAMTVNPGFAGQPYLDFVDEKIETLVAAKERLGYEIVTDGCMTPAHIARLAKAGVDGMVLGTKALFGFDESYAERIAMVRAGSPDEGGA